ncbi:MAG: ATP-binding cassette domain-containing protein, partial [Ilumatobacteraceae bacterium]
PPDVRLVFQNPALLASLTVRENVGFLLYRHSRLSEREIRERVGRALEAVGLAGIEELLPGELSGGMQKRVSFARALIDDPATARSVTLERAFLAELGSGCSLPVGAHHTDGVLRTFLAGVGGVIDRRSIPIDDTDSLDVAREAARAALEAVGGW